MSDTTPRRHHICPYLCCHLEHAAGACPLEECNDVPCAGEKCWWYDKRADVPAGVDHFASRWVQVHRDGSVPIP